MLAAAGDLVLLRSVLVVLGSVLRVGLLSRCIGSALSAVSSSGFQLVLSDGMDQMVIQAPSLVVSPRLRSLRRLSPATRRLSQLLFFSMPR